ncbi:DUF4238 domain-containing protein [Mycobacterium sp. 20091114027_K0903767]|nr:DUF4238 domain-containing protein [Mycobacterium sp. 20091114027_K0903767]
MYLKRFARQERMGFHVVAADVSDLSVRFTSEVKNVAVERGFYWGTDSEGIPHHEMERFLVRIEALGARAFRQLLDGGKLPTDNALPAVPLRKDTRLDLSWWIAAQLLRTTRQRARLDVSTDTSIDVPGDFQSANRHIKYIINLIRPLAAVLFARPWGVGFSDYCLLTGDVPVLVINGQDASDQVLAADYWDVYLALDPHRCLFLPGLSTRRIRNHWFDRTLKLHPGIAIALNNAVSDVAVKHVFFHPDHDPTSKVHVRERGELQAELVANTMPRYLVGYDVLGADCGVERRWLDEHPAPSPSNHSTQLTESEVAEAVEIMANHLDKAEATFRDLAT